MANIFENKDRRVIPNWRSLWKTSKLGELNSLEPSKLEIRKTVLSIDEYKESWEFNKTVSFAGDLISAAQSNCLINDLTVQEAAKFILDNPKLSTKSQKALAQKVLNQENLEKIRRDIKSISLDQLDSIISRDIIKIKIQNIKRLINNFQFNPIIYVELARNYSILGQSDKAINAMKIALHLAPDNRFVLRSAVRLFAHCKELELAHDTVRKSNLIIKDPWIISAEIALSTLRNRNSRFIKKGIEMVNSKNIHPFEFTELASSLGTVELINGNIKKSRDFFRSSLISPNDNSLAQAEWASSKDIHLDFDPYDFKINQHYEALALEHFNKKEFEDAIKNSLDWFIDMPFSKRPIMFGSHIAKTFLRDNETSRGFLKAGLLSHPNDPQILNNIAYSLALENQISDALSYLNRINETDKMETITQICVKATRGLTYFRSGLLDQGRKLYQESINEAHSINSNYYNWLAILNYAREEILVESEFVETVMGFVNKIPDSNIDDDLSILKSEVIDLYKKIKH